MGGVVSPSPSFASSYLREDDESCNVDGGPIIDAFKLRIAVHCNRQIHVHHLDAVNNVLYNVRHALIESTLAHAPWGGHHPGLSANSSAIAIAMDSVSSYA